MLDYKLQIIINLVLIKDLSLDFFFKVCHINWDEDVTAEED